MDIQPLSLKTRRIISSLFFILFLLILPMAVMYASGYRVHNFALTEVGGIYVSVPEPGVTIYLNDKPVERSNLFTRSFFIDNLVPGSYMVRVSGDEYRSWSKRLVVEPRVVTDVTATSVSRQITSRRLIVTAATHIATGTQPVSAQQFAALEKIFATSTPALQPSVKGSTAPADRDGGKEIVIEKGRARMVWTESFERTPSMFCTRPSLCVLSFSIDSGNDTVTSAKFYAGGIVYAERNAGVFFTEADIREPRLVVPVYARAGSTFRIVDGALYIKNGKNIYAVEGLR